ncbi:hypothetical protein P3T32_000989 [Ralstonia sp. GP73]|uniref:DUF6471 domain-containing protein n=1 Tax=Ralstonia thomasii TaxID=3058596 RepID=A0ABN9J5N8_9RALS|nr:MULTISPECIES: DUF6471 domain-containing protein [Ralstonia]MDH6641154.1 hypothetical protein [Ralstonia sp. GP73]OCS45608.1 hypothetical protein BEK68_21930 [Ralstonia pickettii]CAJ0799556.1 hypothetical protein LMG18095_03341 [Ralstonia sp. LMG 18095]CAJ0888908.1 hypothetical protein R6138_03328 [Ralstonia sp. LMG 18095]
MNETQRNEVAPAEPPYAQWEERAKELVLWGMAQRKLGYKELARRLERYGIEESADQINRKVNRKRFSAAFLLACLTAMELQSIPILAKPKQTSARSSR